MKTKIIFIFIIIIIPSASYGDYYSGTEGLYGEELKSTLHEIIKDHIEFSYADLRDSILLNTDEDPNDSNNVVLIYTGISKPKSGFGGMVDDWNREHIWAKSHGNFNNDPPAGTDAHHIRASNVYINSMRGNRDFDNGGDPVYYNIHLGGYRTEYSFEPIDKVKGDIARMIFYMVVRYEGEDGEPDLEMVDYIPSSPNNEPFHAKSSTLFEWHWADPIDSLELIRNDKIFLNWQQNRNPFIDHPEFVEKIWQYETPDEPTDQFRLKFDIFPNPVNICLNDITFKIYCYNLNINNMINTSSISIYNIQGKQINNFTFHFLPKFTFQLEWDGKDVNNRKIKSGIYLVNIKVGSYESTGKLLILN